MAKALPLHRIEVIRAVTVAGPIFEAVSLTNVSAPEGSRPLECAEDTVGIRLFERRGVVVLRSC